MTKEFLSDACFLSRVFLLLRNSLPVQTAPNFSYSRVNTFVPYLPALTFACQLKAISFSCHLSYPKGLRKESVVRHCAAHSVTETVMDNTHPAQFCEPFDMD